MEKDRNAVDRESVELYERKNLRVTGVKNVVNYYEGSVTLALADTYFTVDGENLNIVRLNLDNGEVVVEGLVFGMSYSDGTERKKGFFGRLLG